MKMQIQNLILNFISENPGAPISAVVSNLPEVERSSVSSALCRLTKQGKVTRRTGADDRFMYSIAGDERVPVHVPAVAPKQEIISTEEWECRFSNAETLVKKGLSRRANRVFLELLDVTSETTLRERIVRYRDRCGCKPSGDDSTLAGHFVGEGLV